MIDYCIIGSGISGSTIANLFKKKYQVAIYDKARGPGGRSSFKRFDKKIGYDHGVQYISCLLYTSPSPRDLSTSRMPSSA